MSDPASGRSADAGRPGGRGRLKGSAFVGVIRTLRAAKEAGRKATPAELRNYLEKRILLSSWYPEADAVELIRAMNRIWQPPDGKDPWEFVGRVVAREFASGPYQGLIRKGDPLATLQAYPQHWQLRHDTGDMVITPDGKNRARVELKGYDLAAAEYCRSIGGSMAGLLEIAGAKDVVAEHVACAANGEPACVWTVTWS